MTAGSHHVMRPATYPIYEKPSGWNAMLPPRNDVTRLVEDTSGDVAIVGGGFTGIAAAKRWAELHPESRVLLLDATEVGEGSAGRNSGFLLEISLANDADPADLDRMHECNALISDAMEEIRVAVAGSNAPCRLHRTGTYRAAAGDAGLRQIDEYCAFLKGAGLPFEDLNRRVLARRIGTTFYERGIYSPHCYLAQPAELIRCLATTLPQNVHLYEMSPVIRVTRAAPGWSVSTPAATVRAATVMLANNAFAKRLGGGASRVATIYTYAGLTEPLPESVLGDLGSDTNWGLLPAHRLGSTLRRTEDGRLLIRSFYGYEAEASNEAMAAKLRDCLERRYPDIGEIRFHSVWSGATGFTLNGAPQWGRIGPDLYVSAGCNGGGIVKGTLFGRLLADLAAGLDVPDIGRLFGMPRRMPPEPIRRIGFHVLSTLEARRGVAEI